MTLDMKVLDKLTNSYFKKEQPFKGHAGKMMEMMMKGSNLTGLTFGSQLTRRRRMRPGIRVTSLGRTGREIEHHDFIVEVPFQKDGTMSITPSKIFQRLLKRVKDGGAIFIEKVWVK